MNKTMRLILVAVFFCFAVPAEAAVSLWDSMLWTNDTWYAPVAVLSNLPGNPTSQTGASISVGGNYTVAYSYRLDNSALSSSFPCNDSLDLSGLAAGAHTLQVFARDSSNDWQVNPTLYSWTIDSTAPNAPIATSASPITNTTTPTWTWSSGGNGGNGTYRYKLDSSDLTSGATETATASYTPATALSDASHMFYVQERDAAGNWSVSGSYAVIVDTTGPAAGAVSINLGAAYANAIAVNLALSCTDTGGVWETKASLPGVRSGAAGEAVAGRLYVAGGSSGSGATNTLLAYDPSVNVWETKASMQTPRSLASAAEINGQLYVVGGWLNSDSNSPTNVLEIYNPANNTWASGPTMPTSRGAAVAAGMNGKLYVTGGSAYQSSGAPQYAQLEIYDGSSWSTGAALPTARENAAGVALNGKFYVIGGFVRTYPQNSPYGYYTGIVEVYDPASNTWSTKTPMPTARYAAAAGVINGQIHVLGGSNNSGKVNTHEIYDPPSDTWSTAAPLSVSRSNLSSGVIDGKLYAAAGGSSSALLNMLEVFTPQPGSGCAGMLLSNVSNFSGAVEEIFAAGKTWTLANGDGAKTVYAKFKDTVGNWSAACNDTITLDTTGPAVTPSVAGGTFTSTQTVTLACNDSFGSGCGSIFYTNDSTTPTTSSRHYASPIIIAAGTTLKFFANDSAGNSSQVQTEAYTIDTVAPNAAVVSSVSSLTTNTTPTWTWTSGGGGGNGTYRYKLDSNDSGSGTTETTTASYTPGTALSDGSHVLYVQERDAAGNWSASGSFAVTVDTTGPLGGGASGAFAATGSMSATRAYHAATLLSTGQVLIAGGESGSGSVLVAELYDPATGQFAASGSLNSGRGGHSAVLLPDGKVLLVGGNNYSGTALNSAELYDPATDTFTVTGSMSVARYYGTATLLTNGTVLITGGANGSTRLNSAELYDPATGAFTPTGNMLSRRFGDDATLLANGKVLITGGYNENDLRLNTAELYDPATGIFTATGSMSSARNNQEGVLLANGKVLIAGSWNGSASLSAAELYDPATATFAATGSMTSARSGQKVTLLPNGKVLLTGGWSGGTQTGNAEIYDPAKGVFSATAGMSIGRQLHTATLLANGKVLITGGLQGSTLHSSAELYTPAADAVAINANAVAGNTTSVTLALAATDASGIAQMMVSNDSLFSGAVAEIYATSKSWTLASGDGTKAVYVKFKDAVGNWSAAYNDTIILDTTSPAIAPSLAGGTFNAAQSVTLSCNDSSGSGCGSIYYTNDSSTPTTSSFLYSRPITIAASTTLKYIAIDRAGNSSPVQTTTYTIDTTAPNAAAVSSTAALTNNNKPTWTWTSGGGGEDGTYRYKLDSNDLTSGATQTTTASYTPGTVLSDGSHTLYVQERDAAGNWSAAGSFAVTVDTVGPVGGASGVAQLPQTGQATCYDAAGAVISCAGTGQDGELQYGAAWPNPRFSNPDGTAPISGDIILDKLSGLEWLKDGGTPTVGSCTGGAKTWTAALDYVACLNTANYLGHNDWRLPNINELESLVNAGQSDLPAWLNGQGFTNVQLSRYWSSTTFSSDASVAYYVGMYDGGLQYGGLVAADAKYYNFYIWPVRSEQCSASGNSVNCLPRTGQTISYATGDDGDLEKGVSWPAPRFTDKGDQTVVDNLTSLTWTKDAQAPGPSACGPGTTKTWLAALNYVACLNTNNYLNHNDWRLPNRKELNSLADYSKISPYISIGHPFSNLQASSYWSSSTFVHDTNNAWRVDLNGGYVGGSNKSDSYYVWPVRGGLSGGPAITINSNAASTNTTSVTLTLSATDTNSVSKMTLSNDASFTSAVEENDSASKSWTLSSGDGAKTVYVKFKDAAGNWSPVYNDSIILDSTGPTVTPSPAGGTFNATQTVTLTCNDSSGAGCGSIHYTTDGTTPTTASLRYATPLTIAASTTLKYFANDSTGNSGQVQTTAYTIDAAAPDTTIIGNPALVTNITSASFTFSASEASTFECKLDSGAWTTCTSPQDYTALSVAGHTFLVRAKDTAGNYDPSPASSAWTIDQTGPTGGISINAGATATNSTAVTLGLSASDTNDLTMMLSNDSNFSGASAENYASSKAWTLSSGDGVKTVYAKFKDTAGNWSPVYNDSITLDRTGPDTFITSRPANPSNSTAASFSFTADEANTTFRCQLDSNGYSSCTSPQTYSGLAAGSHAFSVRGQDAVGNNDSTPASYPWTIDTSAPNAVVVSSATAITNNNKPTWTWTSGGGGGNGTYRYKLDSNDSSSGATETTTTSYTPGTVLSDGLHVLYVQERNAAGNWSAAGSFAVTVDTVGPVGAITINNGAASTNTTSVTLTLSATNDVSKMMLSNDSLFSGGAEENDSTSKAWTLSSGDGAKTVYAKFKDDAGNWSRVYNDSITLDSTGPTVTPSPAGGTFTTTQTVTLACNDSTGTGCGSIHYTTDNTTPTTASQRYATPITIAATTTLKYFANDSAGNSGQVQTTTYTIQGFNITGGATINAVQGDTRSTNLTLTSYGDYSQAADLTYAWIGTTPTGATINITPASLTPTPSGAAANVSFTADANTPAGAYTLRITATSGTMVNTADIMVNVSAPLTISTTTLAAGTKGQTYTPTVSATGGVGAYTFSRTSGVLPAGLTLNSNGSFNGTATTRGTYTFTVQANDSDGHTVSQAYDVRIYDNAYRKIVLEATSWTVQQPAASGFIYVKVMDDYVAYVTMTANTNIMVSSSSNTGLFSTDGINWSSSNTISATISSGTSSTYFFYKDSNAGAFTITAAGINGQATEAWEQTSQTITMNEAVISQYALAVNKSGLGAGTVSTSSGTLLWNDSTGRASYASGSSVTLTATAGSDSAFASWSGCTSVNSNQCTVAMSADRNVTVTFNDITPPTAPGVTGPTTPTNNNKPTWTWSSGGNGGNGAYRYKLDSPNLSSGSTETSAASYTPTTALTDAVHTLYVQERDAAENWSLSGSFALTVDTTGPTGTITINANDASTKDTAVILTLSASDASDIAKMMLGNDSSFTNAVAENDSSSKAWSLASGDGTKTVYVKFQDRAGNWSGVYSDTITLDQSAPTLTIGAPSKTLTGNDAVTYTITYSGADTISLASGDITLHTTGTANGSKAVSGTGNSSRTITISGITGNGALGISLTANTGQDAAGNQTASAGPSATVAVDTTKPAVNAGSDQTKNAQFTQTATANDSNTMTYTWTKLTGTGTITFGAPTALSTTISASADGIYTLRFTAMDAAGNSNHDDLTLVWDSGAPTLSISAPSATLTRSSDITYIVTYSGAEAITLSNDSISLNTTGTASATKAVSGDGTTTRTVTLSNIMGDGTLGITIAVATANDSAGNLALASGASATFTVDNTKPVVNAGTDQSRGAQFTQTATANDSNTMTYAWTQEAGTGTITFGTPNARSTTISADADGTYTLRFTAIDAAGNSNYDDLDLLWDTGAPTLSLSAPSATLTRNSDITYTVTYSNADTITLTNDSITLHKTGTASATKAVSGTGTATRTVTLSNISGDGALGLSIAAGTASDTAGNLALASGASSTFAVDNTKPVVNAGANQSRNAEFTQTGIANDSNAMTYAWTQEAGAGTITFGTPDAKSTTISASAEGTYTLRFTAIDAVGNSNFSDLTLVWDTTNPSGALSINDNDSYSKTAAVTLTLACTDSNGCAEMRFSNDGVFSAAPVPSAPTASWTLAAGADGLRTVMVKFKDTVGNWSGAYNDTITLDTAAPVTTISAQPSTPSRLATADFSFNAEADATYQCRIDSDEYATCSSPQNYPDLAEGSHTFSVKATDLAGNIETTPASSTWTIDTGVAAPTGLDLAMADDTGVSNSDNITKNSTGLTISGSGENGAVVQLYDNGNPLNNAMGTVSGVGFSLDVALASGLHYITAVQNDSAGNVSPASAELTITVDQDLPVVAVTNPESGRKAKPMELSGNLSDMLSDIATAEVQVTYTNDQGALRYLKYFYPQGYWDFSSSETWIPVENNPRTGGIWFVDLEWFFSMSRISVWSTGTTYQVKARATDSAGNLGISASNHTFIYGEPDSIITASAGAGGSITPAGQTTLTSGASKMFTITPEQCSAINDVRLDDNSVFDDLVDKGLGKTYTYINSVTGNHTINATFTDQGRSSIIASAGSGGSIWPSGDVTVCGMQDQAFTITPQEGYELLELRIDNQPVALAASYTFTDVTADHAIDAVFARKTYTITASASEHGSITPSGVSIVEHGGSRSFTITPELCYDGNVYVDGGFRLLQNDTYVFSNVTANHTITTNFALICSSGATNLTFDLSSQAILLNGTVDVAGKLSLVNHDVNLDLRGLAIKIRITAPDGSNRTLQTTTSNSNGDFIINGVTGFTVKGIYSIEVIFETSGALQRAEAIKKTLLVGSKAGYAILVQGRISSNEGLLSHNLTARRTYKRLTDRGFTDENIMYLGFSEVQDQIIDGVPSLATLQNAIENWAAATMNDSPAPLYLIMVDHGGRDKFYIGDDYVTPTALNSWLDAMEAKLSPAAGNESRIVIIGSCYSGSFISELSKEGRAIITSSAADEVSWKGPKERDEKGEDIRSGEFFLDELFQQLWRGENLMEAFEAAVERIEKFTDKGGGQSNNAKADNPFFDLAQQHPLLDDNSDHVGSNELQSDSGDGAAAHDIYLGAGLDYDTNSLENPADILAVANSGYLNDSSTTAKLWLRANDNNEVGRAWAEIRSPASRITTVPGGTEQATLELPRLFLTLNDATGLYEASYNAFTASGAYDIFYFVRDQDTEALSSMWVSTVYKNRPGNTAPANFSLIAPNHQANPANTMIFDWLNSTDADGLTYTLTIAADPDFQNIILRQERLAVSMAYTDEKSGLQHGETYWWKVEAVDAFGARTSSVVWSFEVRNPNSMPAIIKGRVYDPVANQSITGATITMSSLGNFYAGDLGLFFMIVQANEQYQATCSAPGYPLGSVNDISVPPGEVRTLNFEMLKQNVSVDESAPTVAALPAGGTYSGLVNVQLSCDDGAGSGCAAIYYTVDGTEPSTVSAQYTAPIAVTDNLVIKFFAKDQAGNSSALQTANYTVQPLAGDVDGSGHLDLADAILVLKIINGKETSGVAVNKKAEVNGDQKIGLQELQYIMQRLAGVAR